VNSGTLVRFGWIAALVGAGSRIESTDRPGTADVVIDVHVLDARNVAVPGADVSIVRGLNDVVAHGTTDQSGRRPLTTPRSSDALQVVVRKIGYARSDQFVLPSHDTVVARIVLREAPQALPTVAVTAEQDLKRKRYHIDADDIADSNRPIANGLDVVTKLRPDMIFPPQGNRSADTCGLFYIWVNGKRVVFPPIDAGLAARAAQQRRAARATPHMGITGVAAVPVSVQSVLATIHPEHIEEINYAGCDDFSVDAPRARNAVFVTLKPGVAFEAGRGSFVSDAASYAASQANSADDSLSVDDTKPVPLPAYRHRLLGVFDALSGDPIEGADVLHVETGTFATTTRTGTVSLVFLPEGTSTLKIRKAGYADTTMRVAISPKDTVPITVVITKP
jgi:hypothetical protein